MTQLKEGYCQVFELSNGFERASYIIKNANGNSTSDNGRLSHGTNSSTKHWIKYKTILKQVEHGQRDRSLSEGGQD